MSTVHELVEAAARRHADRTAITAADGSVELTYAELLARTRRLERRLRREGVSLETPVAVLLNRSPLLPVALLAVLRAGGAYVPLDPTHPEKRLEYAIAQSGARLVLTERQLAPTLSFDVPLVAVDEDEWVDGETTDDPPHVDPEALAYVIYTSGSTGVPKGVAVTHGSVVALLGGMAELVEAGPDDSLLAITTIAFDIAALELFLPLVTGGTVVVAPPAAVGDGSLLRQLLEGRGATLFQATPATWRLLVDSGWRAQAGFRGLCGGEALPRPLARDIAARTTAWNVYGPTETTIWSSAQPLGEEEGGEVVSIGRPLAGEQAHVLDPSLSPVADDVLGELYLGGVGLARGYYGQPDLTAERFVPDPFGPPGARLYRTGDRARRLADGRLEFVGRVDHQVKVRGFRIEPSEIEAVLLGLPGVRECVVAAAPDSGSSARLVAYVAGTQLPPAGQLREALGESLPDYMIPSLFMALPELPRNTSGKIDRAALPEPDPAQSLELAPYEEPQPGPETVIAQIWASLLEADTVGATDSFFDLGGHSLMIAQLHFRLNAAFEVTLPLLELFVRPTVREQAVLVEEHILERITEMTDEEIARALGGAGS